MSGRGLVVLLTGVCMVAVVAIALRALRDESRPPSGGDEPGPASDGADSAPPVGGPSSFSVSPPDSSSAIDARSTGSPDTAAAWEYRRATVEDLDGDGVPERLILASDVFVTGDGEPVWEDEQRWALYVEEDDGKRTLVYSGYAAPGAVSAAVGLRSGADDGSTSAARPIVIVEQDAGRARLLLVVYDGPGRRRLIDAAGTRVDAWVDRVVEETR
jgi:hypothetical protein